MYWIATTIRFYNRERHETLGEAIARAKQLLKHHPHVQFDVMTDVDATHTRVVWASNCKLGTTYPKTRLK